MTEQNAAPPPAAAPAASPEHEGALERLGGWFRHDAEPALEHAAAIIAPEIKAALRAHAGEVFTLAAKLLAGPSGAELAGEILAVAESTARLAGAAHRG